MKQEIILGLDISSSTIGYSIFLISKSKTIQLIHQGHIKPPKQGNLFERLTETQKQIRQLLEQYKPTKVGIEEIAQFIPRKSTANVIITLATFNRAVGLEVFDYLKKSPELFPVITMRSAFKTGKQLPKKEDMPKIMEYLLNTKLKIYYNRNGRIKSETYDQSDAIVVGYYYCLKLTNQLPEIKNKLAKLKLLE